MARPPSAPPGPSAMAGRPAGRGTGALSPELARLHGRVAARHHRRGPHQQQQARAIPGGSAAPTLRSPFLAEPSSEDVALAAEVKPLQDRLPTGPIPPGRSTAATTPPSGSPNRGGRPCAAWLALLSAHRRFGSARRKDSASIVNDVPDLVQALRHRVTLLTAVGLLRDAVWRLGCGS